MKRVLKTIAIVLLLFSITVSHAIAEGDGTTLSSTTPTDPMYGATSGIYKNENVFYSLDIVSPSQITKKGFTDAIWDVMSGEFVEEEIGDALHLSIFYIVQMLFQFNLFMTNLMIGILNFAYDVNIINSLIDSVKNVIVSMTGISGNVFGSSGLYGGFLGVITVIVSIYTLYQFIVKKASITAFSGLLKSLIALTISLWFFSNYSTIIKGANTLAIEASGLVLSGNADMVVNETGNINSTTLREKMNDNIFNMSVHKPYLMLQYSTTNQSAIGDERVLRLLKERSGSEVRNEKALEDVTAEGNDTLTYPNVLKRLNFSAIMLLTNTVSAIPIYLLSGALIVFQFWFLVIAMIAPFALLWSALPNQFGVLKRYFLELSVPLVLKLGVSILALVIFGLSEVIQNISALGNGTTLGFILTVLIQALILLTLFILRKRIFSIFSKGSELLNSVRQEMDTTFVNPFKKGLQNVGTVGGATIGAVVAGPQGAMVGASMGSNIAGLATGDNEPGDFARNTAMNMIAMDKIMAKRKPNIQETVPNEKPVETITSGENNDLMADSDGLKLAYYLQDKGLSPNMVDKTFDALEKQGLSDITTDEMSSQFERILDQTKRGNMKSDFANTFAKGIAQERLQQMLENERTLLLDGGTRKNSSLIDISSPRLGGADLKENYPFSIEKSPILGCESEDTDKTEGD